jgi:anaerobic C4-dicarboxylate transporter
VSVDGRAPRVLVISPDYPPAKGGIQILTHRVVEHLTRITPTVVTLAAPGYEAFDAATSLDIRRVSLSRAPRVVDVARLNARPSRPIRTVRRC